jgi:hypothetical protein
MGMMRYFQWMLNELINHIDHDEGMGFSPNEGSQRTHVASGCVHRELEKVKFPDF